MPSHSCMMNPKKLLSLVEGLINDMEQMHLRQDLPAPAAEITVDQSIDNDVNGLPQGFVAELPIGYRFLPTDFQAVHFYLTNKALNRPLPAQVIEDTEASLLYSKPPNRLVSFVKGERQWFFFVNKLPKDFNGGKVGDGLGLWQVRGLEEPVVHRENQACTIAWKLKFAYFHQSSHVGLSKTHWKMFQYRLTDPRVQEDEWVMVKLIRGMDDT